MCDCHNNLLHPKPLVPEKSCQGERATKKGEILSVSQCLKTHIFLETICLSHTNQEDDSLYQKQWEICRAKLLIMALF